MRKSADEAAGAGSSDEAAGGGGSGGKDAGVSAGGSAETGEAAAAAPGAAAEVDFAALARCSVRLETRGSWDAMQTEDGRVFFQNNETKEAQWERPVVADVPTEDAADDEAEADAGAISQATREVAPSMDMPSDDPRDLAPGPLTEDEIDEVCGLPGNELCVDCGSSAPAWSSVSHGVLICTHCSGTHRSLGVHVSFVKSLTLDNWSGSQLRKLRLGGNATLQAFFKEHGEPQFGQERYHSEAADLYRRRLTALERGEAPPTALPTRTAEEREALARARETSAGGALVSGRNQTSRERPRWVPDKEAPACNVCKREFSMTFRRHHCRACGHVVCGFCAPKDNTKPIPALGYREPVRHCSACYKSPFVDFEAVQLAAAKAEAAAAEGRETVVTKVGKTARRFTAAAMKAYKDRKSRSSKSPKATRKHLAGEDTGSAASSGAGEEGA